MVGSIPMSGTKDPTSNGNTHPLWCVNLARRLQGYGEGYTRREIRITSNKRGLPTWGSSVGYVGNKYERVPHYELRGSGALISRVVTHKSWKYWTIP